MAAYAHTHVIAQNTTVVNGMDMHSKPRYINVSQMVKYLLNLSRNVYRVGNVVQSRLLLMGGCGQKRQGEMKLFV